MIALGTVIAGVTISSLITIAIYLICAASWYRIVPATEVHLVTTPKKRFVASSDRKISQYSTYFEIPSWIPFFGRTVRIIDATIKEVRGKQDTIEKDNARYVVDTSLKYRVKDIETAANTIINEENLNGQLDGIINAAVRAATVKYAVQDARAKKKDIEAEIREQLDDDLAKFGLELVSFQLVDFSDTEESKIISNISKRQEISIEALTREMNAEKIKSARMKEAIADQEAKKQEIERDQQVALRDQERLQKIAEQAKVTEQKRLEVEMTQKTMTENINKAAAEIQANKAKEVAKIEAERDKEVANIQKEALKSQGEGYRVNAEEKAKGDAASIREKGLAEADAKNKLQEALNKFKPEAINALVADKLVEKDRAIGIANAEALKAAKINVMAGGNDEGFEIAKYLQSMKMVDSSTSEAILNRIAKPNDLGGNGVPVTPVRK